LEKRPADRVSEIGEVQAVLAAAAGGDVIARRSRPPLRQQAAEAPTVVDRPRPAATPTDVLSPRRGRAIAIVGLAVAIGVTATLVVWSVLPRRSTASPDAMQPAAIDAAAQVDAHVETAIDAPADEPARDAAIQPDAKPSRRPARPRVATPIDAGDQPLPFYNDRDR